ncbi:MAG: hypothetical protein ABFC89_03715 [Methanospirillum sp.]
MSTGEGPGSRTAETVRAQGDPTAIAGLDPAVRELANYCPSTLLATKAVRTVRGEKPPRPSRRGNREQEYRTTIKLGLGIMLFGLFCPIFWGSYLLGVTGDDLKWNAIHSGLVALAGLLLAGWYRLQLARLPAIGQADER